MSQKKRRMATVKETTTARQPKRWLRVAVLFSVVALLITTGLYFSTPIMSWFSAIEVNFVSNDSNNDSSDSHRGKNDGVVASNSNERQVSQASWRVAIQNSADFVTPEELEFYIKTNIDDSFFTLDVEQVSALLQEYPWIKNVTARKVYPNVLMLAIEEHQPWLNLNNEKLISHEGVIFQPSSIEQFDTLPLLTGKFGEISDLLSMYHFFSQQMPVNEFRIVQLDFSAHRGWLMKLENGIQLFLGKKDLSERLERFLAVVNELPKKSNKELSYIDLRYQSGVAVGWENNKQEQVAQK